MINDKEVPLEELKNKVKEFCEKRDWNQFHYPNFHLTMHCFKCSLINGYPKLLEHEDSKWVGKKNISDLKWLPADLELIDLVKEML